VQQFEELSVGSPNNRADFSENQSLNMVIALADWLDEAMIINDQELNVVFANRVALAIMDKSPGRMAGKPLFTIAPEIDGSLMGANLRHTLSSGEPCASDLLSPFNESSWLRCETFRLDGYIFVKFRDITGDVERHRLADKKLAIMKGMDLHGAVGYVRLSVRGTIEFANEPFCSFVDLPAKRLTGILASDLVEHSERRAFRESLEQVFHGESAGALHGCFLSNRGDFVSATLSMVGLSGAYGTEGAIILVTPDNQVAKSKSIEH
jgi:PAS domain-containing protein